jgi:hypothetical protein
MHIVGMDVKTKAFILVHLPIHMEFGVRKTAIEGIYFRLHIVR